MRWVVYPASDIAFLYVTYDASLQYITRVRISKDSKEVVSFHAHTFPFSSGERNSRVHSFRISIIVRRHAYTSLSVGGGAKGGAVVEGDTHLGGLLAPSRDERRSAVPLVDGCAAQHRAWSSSTRCAADDVVMKLFSRSYKKL